MILNILLHTTITLHTIPLSPFFSSLFFTFSIFPSLQNPIDIPTIHSNTYQGKVETIDHSPVMDVDIRLYGIKHNQHITGAPLDISLIAQSKTNSEGKFTIEMGLSEYDTFEDTFIVTDKEGFAIARSELRFIEDDSSPITLRPATVLEGHVLDEQGNAVENATVHVVIISDTFFEEAQHIDLVYTGKDKYIKAMPSTEFLTTKTDSDGRFRFANIPDEATAEFVIYDEMQRYLTKLTWFPREGLEKGQYVSGERDLHLTVQKGSILSGQVVNAETNAPMPNCKVTLSKKRSTQFPGSFSTTCLTDTQGNFSQLCLPGHYSVTLGPQLVSQSKLPPELHKGVIRFVHSTRYDPMAAHGPMVPIAKDWIAETQQTLLQIDQTSQVTLLAQKAAILEITVKDKDTLKNIRNPEIIVTSKSNGKNYQNASSLNYIHKYYLLPGEYVIHSPTKEGYAKNNTIRNINLTKGKTKRIDYSN